VEDILKDSAHDAPAAASVTARKPVSIHWHDQMAKVFFPAKAIGVPSSAAIRERQNRCNIVTNLAKIGKRGWKLYD
jgi:hypothetical protein